MTKHTGLNQSDESDQSDQEDGSIDNGSDSEMSLPKGAPLSLSLLLFLSCLVSV